MSTLEVLAGKLKSSDAEERREATVDLGRSGRGAVPYLLSALGDRDWRVRKTAVEALVGLGGPAVTSGLVLHLSAHDNAGARNSAIEALVRLGSASVGPLLKLLDTGDPDVRKFAVDVLGDIGDRSAVPRLIDILGDADENVRVAAAESLGKLRDRRAVDALIGCLAAYDESWLDYAAAEALGEIGDERALGPLMTALGRSSLREPVLEALGKIGNVNTLNPLVSGLSDPLRIVREVGVVALCSIYRKSSPDDRQRIVSAVRTGISDRSLSFLDELIDTSSGELQRSTIMVLGWCGRTNTVDRLFSLLCEEEIEEAVAQALRTIGQAGVPHLMEHLSDKNVLARRTAAMVLGDFGRREAETALLALLEDENGHVRGAAAEALGRMKSAQAVETLLHLLEDEYENVQEKAIDALAAIGDESIFDRLLSDFTAWDGTMRRNIVRLLGRFATERSLDALVFALKDEEPDVRKAVVVALHDQPGDRAARPLLLAITDDDPEVRMLAAEALARTGVAEAGDALVPLLSDDDLWVRAAAVRGLGHLDVRRFGNALTAHLAGAGDIFLLALVDVLGANAIPQALDPLLAIADHKDPEVRKTVLQALVFYEWARVRPSVLSRVFDSHWSVRKAAIEVLRGRRDAAVDQVLARMAAEDLDMSVRQAAREAMD